MARSARDVARSFADGRNDIGAALLLVRSAVRLGVSADASHVAAKDDDDDASVAETARTMRAPLERCPSFASLADDERDAVMTLLAETDQELSMHPAAEQAHFHALLSTIADELLPRPRG
jgi:hypothetical protein